MEWTIKLEGRSGWEENETIEVGRLTPRVDHPVRPQAAASRLGAGPFAHGCWPA